MSNTVLVPLIAQFEAGGGDSFGYKTARSLSIRALREAGVSVVEDLTVDFDGDAVLYYCSPHFFSAIAGKRNFLYTMWEANDLPWDLYEMCRKADSIIVPSRHSRDVLKRAGYPKSIKICAQAVDTIFYQYRERVCNGKFRVLWLGAPNIRKGYDLVPKAFFEAFLDNGNTELYLKTSLFEKEGSYTYNEALRTHFDNRNVSKEELRELYYSANVLLYPSRGEGAGLIPMEFMSTGGCAIAPRYSGMADYIFKSVGYPVGFDMIDVNYGVRTKVAECKMQDLVKWLKFTYDNPEDVHLRGHRASKFINDNFSIKVMGERLKNILFGGSNCL